MRQLLVKYFVLDYLVLLFGTRFTISRAKSIVYPLFITTGILMFYLKPYSITPLIILWIFYFLDVVAVFIWFIYFKLKPVKWEELDLFQKFQYGILNRLRGIQYIEWVKIFHKVRTELFNLP